MPRCNGCSADDDYDDFGHFIFKAVFVRGLFSKGEVRAAGHMRCRLILLISEHPIQQGIRKGGGPDFWSRRGRRGEDEDGQNGVF